MATKVRTGPQFWLDGGHPIVDLANTVYDGESLRTFDDVVAWLHQSRLEQRSFKIRSPKSETDALEGVLELRASARAILEAALSGKPASSRAVDRVTAALAQGTPSLVKSGARYTLDVGYDPATPQGAVVPIARAVASFLTHGDPTRVKRCPGCGMFVYDASKNRTRSWCSMKSCGNRAKAAAHYRRTKNRD
jgi:predicted RNA-binding Zn ribbon-like protein